MDTVIEPGPGAQMRVLHLSLPETVHRELRSRILNNNLPAGTPLVELDLARDFGVSRTTIRSALRELQAERLVEIQPRRHTIVIRMSVEEAAEACYARWVVETSGLADVWDQVRRRLVSELTEVVEVMEVAAENNDLAGIVEADTEFHRLIVTASGHPRLIEMWSTLNGQMGALMRSSLDRQGISMTVAVRSHRQLIAAFRSKDSSLALAALRDHYITDSHS